MWKRLKRPNKSVKDCFCTAGICKWTVVFKLKIYNLQMFSRPSDKKCTFVSPNFVLFRIFCIWNPIEHLQWSFLRTQLKAFRFNYSQKKLSLRYSTGLWIRLWIASFAEYFDSLNLSSLCYCISRETHSNLCKKQKTKKLSVNYKSISLLCADAYLDNATGCYYNFRNM